MSLFLISYDLDNPGQKYAAVHAMLKSWGARRVLESTWMVKATNSTCVAMRDALKGGPVDANDRVVVVRVDDWASFRAMIDINQI